MFLDYVVNWWEPACSDFIQLLSRDTQLLLEQNTEDTGDLFIILLHHSSLLIELGSLLERLNSSLQQRYEDL